MRVGIVKPPALGARNGRFAGSRLDRQASRRLPQLPRGGTLALGDSHLPLISVHPETGPPRREPTGRGGQLVYASQPGAPSVAPSPWLAFMSFSTVATSFLVAAASCCLPVARNFWYAAFSAAGGARASTSGRSSSPPAAPF